MVFMIFLLSFVLSSFLSIRSFFHHNSNLIHLLVYKLYNFSKSYKAFDLETGWLFSSIRIDKIIVLGFLLMNKPMNELKF